MAKEEKEKKEIEASEGVVDEKKLLKEAEEREKERKEQEEIDKATAKEIEKAEKAEAKEEKIAQKVQVRVKPRHGKKYRELESKIEKGKEYSASEAIDLALTTSPAKFDATVELHIKINKKEKNIRGMVVLPGGLTKEKRILEVTEKNIDEVITDVRAGKFDFDVMIAEMKLMPKLAPLAKVLGPKGLMPSPKAGTAVVDVAEAAKELKSGKVEYRADKDNVVHMSLGRISFGEERIKKNYDAIVAVLPMKRADSIFLSTSMGPSISVVRK